MKKLFEQPSDQDPNEQLDKEFDGLEINLKQDITHVDHRMSDIQQYIITLDSQLNSLQVIIKNEKDSSKKGGLYKVYNNTLEMIARFQQIYQTFFQTKYNYRREHDDLICRKLRLIKVDMKRAEDGELTPTTLLTVLQQLSGQIEKDTGGSNKVSDSIDELDSDDLYKI